MAVPQDLLHPVSRDSLSPDYLGTVSGLSQNRKKIGKIRRGREDLGVIWNYNELKLAPTHL